MVRGRRPAAVRPTVGAATATAGSKRRLSLGAAPWLACLTSGALVLVAAADNAARDSAAAAEPLFWCGLLLIFVPITFRLLSVGASRAERISLVVLLGVALFIVKVLYDPLDFVFYDELGWWRATSDLLQTGHPFSSNPLVISTSGFPGLSLTAGALAELTGLSIFHAGLIVIGVARATLMLALFLLLERATRSARAAGIGVAIYACNPVFLYFSSQFAYESLALLIGLSLLVVTLRWSDWLSRGLPRVSWELVGGMALLACTLSVTHHMTAYAIFAFLVTWAALIAHRQRRPEAMEVVAPVASPSDELMPRPLSLASKNPPALPALFLGTAAAIWFAFVAGGVTISELGSIFSGAFSSILDLVRGSSGPKVLESGVEETNTTLARAFGAGSVVLLLAAIPLGLRRIRREPTSSTLAWTLGLVALLYLPTLVLRLTHGGGEISQRSSAFVFLGLAFVVAVLVREPRWPWVSSSPRANRLVLTALAGVIFVGGFVIGEPPQGRLPGPFLVSAERRSITPQGLAAAEFAAAELPPGSRILVDHANGLLLASYGHLDPVQRRVDGIPITRVFFPKNLDRRGRRVITDGEIDYIVVDNRLARTPPVVGYYFSRGEPRAFRYTEPIRRAALRKFRRIRGINKIYGNGPIAIYDTSGLRSE